MAIAECGRCYDREIIDWAASTGGYDKETVQDVMLGAMEKRFGRQQPTEPLEWLTDNGSAYRAHETRAFARLLGLEPCATAVRSPESNGIAESFVKTIKRDYISIMPKPDGGDESGSGVQSLQRTSSTQRAGVSFTTGIYT